MSTGHDDIITVLTTDHRELERLLTELERLGGGDGTRRKKLADRLIDELARHVVVEERWIHPVIRERVPKLATLADRAQAQHAEAEQLVDTLDTMDDADDPRFDATLGLLAASVRAHIDEQEKVVFPAVVDACTVEDLEALGAKAGSVKDTPLPDRGEGSDAGPVTRVRDALPPDDA